MPSEPDRYRFGHALELVLNSEAPLEQRHPDGSVSYAYVSEATLFLRRVAKLYQAGKLGKVAWRNRAIMVPGSDTPGGVPLGLALASGCKVSRAARERDALEQLYRRHRGVIAAHEASPFLSPSGYADRLEKSKLTPRPWEELVVIAAEQLFWVIVQRLPLLRCEAPGPRNEGTCGNLFVDIPRGRHRQFCSPRCQQLSWRWDLRRPANRRKERRRSRGK